MKATQLLIHVHRDPGKEIFIQMVGANGQPANVTGAIISLDTWRQLVADTDELILKLAN